ncbi:hypothetical protein CTheo_3735 [Ceratobasidium theobromae]|uniref:DUF6534 domain-containing protein n=1 Tax=Ceratobasidium theobromae TaxID=1582974 RepID=A0A5N5QM14_9AGAM|nr:hypothetical protein CTheo_3735 [Ceratobasidium theobromae]
MTVMISSAAQCFFAWRVAKLTGKVWLGWLIGVSAFVQFAAGTGLTIGLFIVGEFSRFQELRTAVIIWLVLSAITDILITCILVWYLRTHRTSFSQTDDVISRAVRSEIRNSDGTNWIDHYNMGYNGSHPLLGFGKLYTNSLMSTLNCRTGWGGNFSPRGVNSQGSESEGSTRQSRRVSVWNPDQSKMNSPTGIQVVTVATVHRDDEVELEESGSDVAKKKSRLSRDL